MLVVSNSMLDGADVHTGHVDIPAVDVVALRQGMHEARVDGVAVDDLNLGEADTLLKARGSLDARHHHQLDELLAFCCELPTFGFFESIFGRGNVLGRKRFEELLWRGKQAFNAGSSLGGVAATYHLQLVLPKLLLAGLVEEGKVANMVNEDVAKDGQLGVEGRDFADVRLEGRAEALEGGGGVELRHLILDLLCDELALEVWKETNMSARPWEAPGGEEGSYNAPAFR